MSARYIAKSDKQTSSRRAKLVSNLALFDNLMIVHIPGNKNVVTDFLPRVYESILSDNDDPITLKKRKLEAVKEKQRVEMLLQQDPKHISQSIRKLMNIVSRESCRQPTSEQQPSADTYLPSTRPKLAQTSLSSHEGDVNKVALAAQTANNDASIQRFITNEVSTYDLVYQ